MHANAVRVAAAAESLGLGIEIREFPAGTRTAEDAAAAIGVDLGQIVKSLVFAVDGEPVLALVSGSNRLDEAALAAAAGGSAAARMDADAVRAATGYPVGGIPPFGHATPLRTFCDEDLLQWPVVWAAAGTPRENFGVDPSDLVRVTGAVVCRLRAWQPTDPDVFLPDLFLRRKTPAELLAWIVDVLRSTPEPNERLCGEIGVGNLESLLMRYEEELWPQIEQLARTDIRFRRALRSVWAFGSPAFERRQALMMELGESVAMTVGFVAEPEGFGDDPPMSWRALEVTGTIPRHRLAECLRSIADHLAADERPAVDEEEAT